MAEDNQEEIKLNFVAPTSRRPRTNLRNLRGSWSLFSIPEDESTNLPPLIRRHSRHFCDLTPDSSEETICHRSPVTAENGYKPFILFTNPDPTKADSSNHQSEEEQSNKYFPIHQVLCAAVQNVVIFSAFVCCVGCWTLSAILLSKYLQR